jgi:hypothetical protein
MAQTKKKKQTTKKKTIMGLDVKTIPTYKDTVRVGKGKYEERTLYNWKKTTINPTVYTPRVKSSTPLSAEANAYHHRKQENNLLKKADSGNNIFLKGAALQIRKKRKGDK